jgi:hypothetical protein
MINVIDENLIKKKLYTKNKKHLRNENKNISGTQYAYNKYKRTCIKISVSIITMLNECLARAISHTT